MNERDLAISRADYEARYASIQCIRQSERMEDYYMLMTHHCFEFMANANLLQDEYRKIGLDVNDDRDERCRKLRAEVKKFAPLYRRYYMSPKMPEQPPLAKLRDGADRNAFLDSPTHMTIVGDYEKRERERRIRECSIRAGSDTDVDIRAFLEHHIKYQSDAMMAISRKMYTLGFRPSGKKRRPTIVTLFASGTSGTGKSETGRLICEHLLGMAPFTNLSKRYVVLDANLLKDSKMSASMIGGSGPGYIGSLNSPTYFRQMTEALADCLEAERQETLNQYPLTVKIIALNIEEYDKMDPEVADCFNTLMDKGRLKGGTGELFQVPPHILLFIYCTANFGSDYLRRVSDEEYDEEDAVEAIIQDMRSAGFKDCDVGRCGQMIPFRPLTGKQAMDVLRGHLQKFMEENDQFVDSNLPELTGDGPEAVIRRYIPNEDAYNNTVGLRLIIQRMTGDLTDSFTSIKSQLTQRIHHLPFPLEKPFQLAFHSEAFRAQEGGDPLLSPMLQLARLGETGAAYIDRCHEKKCPVDYLMFTQDAMPTVVDIWTPKKTKVVNNTQINIHNGDTNIHNGNTNTIYIGGGGSDHDDTVMSSCAYISWLLEKMIEKCTPKDRPILQKAFTELHAHVKGVIDKQGHRHRIDLIDKARRTGFTHYGYEDDQQQRMSSSSFDICHEDKKKEEASTLPVISHKRKRDESPPSTAKRLCQIVEDRTAREQLIMSVIPRKTEFSASDIPLYGDKQVTGHELHGLVKRGLLLQVTTSGGKHRKSIFMAAAATVVEDTVSDMVQEAV